MERTSKNTDLPHAELGVQMSNYDMMNLKYKQHDAKMSSEFQDIKREEWSDMLVQTCLSKLLDNMLHVKEYPENENGELWMLKTFPGKS